MRPQIIDEYNYCSTKNNKTKVYQKDNYSEEEKEKTRKIRKDILDFIRVIISKSDYHDSMLESDKVYEFVCYETYDGIHYNDTYGYISKGNYDRDIVHVYFYGNTHEEAFKTAVYEIIMDLSHNFELWHREELTKDFCNRFKDGIMEEDEYHGPFIFAEHSLQLLAKYYGENIPKEFLDEFNAYIDHHEDLDLEFNFETNRFEIKEPVKTLKRTRGDLSDKKETRENR